MAQFEKGQSGNPATQFVAGAAQEEIARRGAIACNESKRRKKTLREAVRTAMETKRRTSTGEMLDGFDISAIDLQYIATSTKIRPETRIKAKKLIADLLGEMTQQIEAKVQSDVKVLQVSPEDAEDVKELLYGRDSERPEHEGLQGDEEGVEG